MVFTYDISTAIGKVRHRIGDVTDGGTLGLTDEEITYELGRVSSDILRTAYACVLALKSRASRIISGGSQSPDRGSLIRQLDDIADDIRSEMPCEIFAGGVYEADREAAEDSEADGTLSELPFRVGMDDYPGTGRSPFESETDDWP